MDVAVGQKCHLRRTSCWTRIEIASLGIRPALSFAEDSQRIQSWRCGRISIEDGWLECIEGRWWPYRGNMLRTFWDLKQRPLKQDRCELFYHLPMGSPGFLTLSYVRSGPRTSLSSFYAATLALDQIVKLKQGRAIVCHVTNNRISDRLLERWGWRQHCLDWPGRHFIKRFYEEYPAINTHWRERLRMG